MPVRFRAPFIQLDNVVHRDARQAELPAPSELNYDSQPRRILRQFRPGISHAAGLSQWGMPQTFDRAYLPPPVRLGPIQKVRNIGGAYGLGVPAATVLHIPSVLVPRAVG